MKQAELENPDAQTLVSIISRERAKDPTKWGSQEIATLISLGVMDINGNPVDD